jgi:hypothetical protein
VQDGSAGADDSIKCASWRNRSVGRLGEHVRRSGLHELPPAAARGGDPHGGKCSKGQVGTVSSVSYGIAGLVPITANGSGRNVWVNSSIPDR